MDSKRATLHALAPLPRNFLQKEKVLFYEAANLMDPANVLTTAEFRELLNRLESERLVIGERVHDEVKWKITGEGRAWLKES